MDIAVVAAKAVTKAVAKKGLCILADAIVPGSGLIVKGAFRASGLFGADRAAEVVGKLGVDRCMELAGDIGNVEDTITDSIIGLITGD